MLKEPSLEPLRIGNGFRLVAVPRSTKFLGGISYACPGGSLGDSWGDLVLAKEGVGLTMRPPVMTRLEDISERLGLERSDRVMNERR